MARLLAGCLLFFAVGAAALQSDRGKPVQVDAGHADFDEKSGVTVLTGGVHLEQGTLKIDTVKATLHRDEKRGDLHKIELEGNPATMSQMMDDKPDEMHASAHRIEYDLDKNTLTLIKEARLTQGARAFSGERLEYDMKDQRVKAGETGSRVHMTFEPGGGKPQGN